MTISKRDLRAYLWAFILAAFLNSDGLVKWLLWNGMDAGWYNPVWSPLIVGVLLAIYLRYRHPGRLSVWLLAGIALTALLALHGWQSGIWSKCARDILYLWMILMTWQAMRAVHIAQAIDLQRFAKALLVLAVIVIPCVTYFGLNNYYDMYDEGRFGSFMITPTVLAINLFLVLWLADLLIDDWRWTLGCLPFVFFFVALSGTRVVFLLLIAYLACRMTLALTHGRHSPALRLLALLICMATVLVPLFVLVGGTDHLQFGGLRILEFGDDKEYGSVYSRTHYYQIVWKEIVQDWYWGGYGAGTAEKLTNILTHFDLLRFWHDYSLVYPVALLLMLGDAARAFRRRAAMPLLLSSASVALCLYALFILGAVVLLSTHNIFQIPGALMLMTMTIFYSHHFMAMPRLTAVRTRKVGQASGRSGRPVVVVLPGAQPTKDA